MNPYPQAPDNKRFRPNSNSTGRPWIPPPSQPYQPHVNVHPSRQSQLPPPPPPIAPYHQSQTQQPPFYPQLPPHSNPYNAMPHALRRNKSSDPRQRHRTHAQAPMNAYSNAHNLNESNDAILDVLHIAPDEAKNFGAFAVTMNQIYGSRNVDPLPFGGNSSSAIHFDGRIKSQPILSFLPQAMDGPSKKVRVYELSPLAAADKQCYDELVAFYTKIGRCPVVDKEYNQGILLYLIPPKLIFKKVDPSMNAKEEKLRKKHRKKRTEMNEMNKINFVQLLGLNASEMKEDKVWMISIISTSKYLLFKQKNKENEKKKSKKKNKKTKKKKKKMNEADLSDIEISDDEEDESESAQSESDNFEDDEDEYDENGQRAKDKKEEIVKSDLIVALEALYKKIGQRLPD